MKALVVGDPKGKIPTAALEEAYATFCSQNNLTVLPKQRLLSYLRETFQIESRTIRVPWLNGGQPSFGYVGIRFSEEYQALLAELPDDDSDSDEWPRISEEDEDEPDASEDGDDWSPDFEHCEGLLA